jgi:hypothetical protein
MSGTKSLEGSDQVRRDAQDPGLRHGAWVVDLTGHFRRPEHSGDTTFVSGVPSETSDLHGFTVEVKAHAREKDHRAPGNLWRIFVAPNCSTADDRD